MDSIRSTLLDIVAKEAMMDRATLVENATLDDLGIESLDLVSVIFEIEEQFKITLDMEDVAESPTLGAMLTFVIDQIVKTHAVQQAS